MFGLNDNNQTNGVSPAPGPAMPSAPDLPTQPPVTEAPVGFGGPAPQIHLDKPSVQPVTSAPPVNADLLMGLKEQALSSLSPLVNHLNQTPEEHFKTMMMLIQASDNSALIKEAYEAANQIPDEKARAQALLDVINEINYFTQKDENPEVKNP